MFLIVMFFTNLILIFINAAKIHKKIISQQKHSGDVSDFKHNKIKDEWEEEEEGEEEEEKEEEDEEEDDSICSQGTSSLSV